MRAPDDGGLGRRAATRTSRPLRLITGFRGTDTHGLKAFVPRPLERWSGLHGRAGPLRQRAGHPAQRNGRHVRESPSRCGEATSVIQLLGACRAS